MTNKEMEALAEKEYPYPESIGNFHMRPYIDEQRAAFIKGLQDPTRQVKEDWISVEIGRPNFGVEVEVSDDGETVLDIAEFKEKTQCAGYIGTGRYFYNKFESVKAGLVLTDVTHWRPIPEPPESPNPPSNQTLTEEGEE